MTLLDRPVFSTAPGWDPKELGFVPLGNKCPGRLGLPRRLVVWIRGRPHLFCRRCGRLLRFNRFQVIKTPGTRCGRASECVRCHSVRRVHSQRKRRAAGAELAEAARERPPPLNPLQGWESAMCF